jgi:hypothetical protein
MTAGMYTIRNKFPELSYAFTLNGVDLPVLAGTAASLAASGPRK